MKLVGLITRCKDEFFIKEFCDYYLSQGIDEIYIIDDDSNDKSIYDDITDKRVKIIYKKGLFERGRKQMGEVTKLYKKIKDKFTWMISVDVDEFITTKMNIKKTIRDELETTFKNCDCIKIPWVMMACNKKEKNPKSVLIENIYRYNHDKKHPHNIYKFRCRYNKIEVKCIFKAYKFDSIIIHHPENCIGTCKIVDSIKKQHQPLTSFYDNLREVDIEKGYLLCYHYRIISKENSLNKLKKAQYLNYTIDDLMNSDYSEVLDETLKYKSLKNSQRNLKNENVIRMKREAEIHRAKVAVEKERQRIEDEKRRRRKAAAAKAVKQSLANQEVRQHRWRPWRYYRRNIRRKKMRWIFT